ncbi:hypothetical protein KIH41_13995 [Litoribacter ruber]|uniref:hypothetical protein n=1 Tax=Litoribacter ruber TaxID=702568 RepID=UPI001BDB3C7D|nr:hypothetical protein [Litoribacter ruber]MBT0812394.1 hypothetical protein [Litoribacter ruber]
MKVKVRIVKSIDDKEAAEKYIQGHHKVLEAYGVTKVTSADTSWINNPNCFLILVENLEDGRVLGGGRIQMKTENNDLPLVEAVREIDVGINQYMDSIGTAQVAEFCGLWNSKEVAGFGIGSIYLGRVGAAICTQLNVNKLLALCSPATLRNCKRVGFSIIESLGVDGKFYYPKEGLIATALEINNVENLPNATNDDRDFIFKLRKDINFSVQESGPKGEMSIEFDIKIMSSTMVM